MSVGRSHVKRHRDDGAVVLGVMMMPLSVLLLLLVLPSPLPAAPRAGPDELGSGCTGPNTCVRAGACRNKLSKVRLDQFSTTSASTVIFPCGFDRLSLLVCCPNDEVDIQVSQVTSSTTLEPPRREIQSNLEVPEIPPRIEVPEIPPRIEVPTSSKKPPLPQRPTRPTFIDSSGTSSTTRRIVSETRPTFSHETYKTTTAFPRYTQGLTRPTTTSPPYRTSSESTYTERSTVKVVTSPLSAQNNNNNNKPAPTYVRPESPLTYEELRPTTRSPSTRPPSFVSAKPVTSVIPERTSTTLAPTQDLTKHRNIRLLPSECGKAAVAPNRIINGNNATVGELPWMVLLGYKTSEGNFQVVCGGTLISWRYVLTAAHCLKSSVRLARLGEHVLSTELDCDNENQCADSVQDVEIEEKVAHPAYNKPYLKNDIALVRLTSSQPKLFSSYVRPICIPLSKQKRPARRRLQVAGWGTTQRGSGNPSDVMQVAELPEVEQEECNSAQEDSLKPLVESQMCAGPSTSRGASACHGDSGGPLMDVQDVTNSLGYTEPATVQLGIVSVGSPNCGLNGSPNIYTRISYFTDWILEHLRD